MATHSFNGARHLSDNARRQGHTCGTPPSSRRLMDHFGARLLLGQQRKWLVRPLIILTMILRVIALLILRRKDQTTTSSPYHIMLHAPSAFQHRDTPFHSLCISVLSNRHDSRCCNFACRCCDSVRCRCAVCACLLLIATIVCAGCRLAWHVA